MELIDIDEVKPLATIAIHTTSVPNLSLLYITPVPGYIWGERRRSRKSFLILQSSRLLVHLKTINSNFRIREGYLQITTTNPGIKYCLVPFSFERQIKILERVREPPLCRYSFVISEINHSEIWYINIHNQKYKYTKIYTTKYVCAGFWFSEDTSCKYLQSSSLSSYIMI